MSQTRFRTGRIGWALVGACAMVPIVFGADLMTLEAGGTTYLRVSDVGATEVVANSGSAALQVRQNNTGKLLVLLDTGAEVVTVLDGGNVGINQPVPGERLHVVGNIAVTGNVDGVDVSAHAANANAHHTPPTNLPPNGPAGGDLGGTYPNPTVTNNSHTHNDSTVANTLTIDSASTITLQAGTTPTIEGRIQWDTTNDRIVVGDGAAAKVFYSGAHASGGLDQQEAIVLSWLAGS